MAVSWFRKKQKEVAETFVEDATEKLKKQFEVDEDTVKALIFVAVPLILKVSEAIPIRKPNSSINIHIDNLYL